MAATSGPPLLANGCPTIGVLIEGFTDYYQREAWNGLVEAAYYRAVNLVAFAGGSLGRSPRNSWEHQRNSVYYLARDARLDGIILMASIGNYARKDETHEFLEQFEGVPMVSLASADAPLTPMVQVDNHQGIVELVHHLVTVHKRTRFAFICGPEQNRDARERRSAFAQALTRHRLVIRNNYYAGDFTRAAGASAVRRMLERDLPYDAIVAANDETAIGALETLRQATTLTPKEISVVGFDDTEAARFAAPPLTTASQPLRELAATAVDRLLRLRRGEKIQKVTRLEPRLVVRVSCGCPDTPTQCAADFSAGRHDQPPARILADAARKEGRGRLWVQHTQERIRAVGQMLNNTLDLRELPDALAKAGTELGISACHLSLYDPSETDADRARFILETDQGLRNLSKCEGEQFPASSLTPASVRPIPLPSACIVQPLYFQDESYGFAILRCSDPPVTEAFQHYAGSALHSSFLVTRIKEQREELAAANRELTDLRKKERRHIEKIDADMELGRRVQRSFLPRDLPQVHGWDFASVFLPARVMSGDFYDCFPLADNLLAFMIADVSGKGPGAALFMALIRTCIINFIDTARKNDEDILDAVQEANRYVDQHYHSREEWMFTTVVIGVLNTTTGEVTYVNAGHVAPLLVRDGVVIMRLSPTGPAVGLDASILVGRGSATMAPGDSLVLYTDGLQDACNAAGAFLTIKGIERALASHFVSARDCAELLVAAARAHVAGAEQHDDITMLVLRRGTEA